LLVDKKFLAETAVSISGLAAQDVSVRILGNVAIMDARIGYTISSPGTIDSQVINLVIDAELVVADLTASRRAMASDDVLGG
jgi:hypothetical protein